MRKGSPGMDYVAGGMSSHRLRNHEDMDRSGRPRRYPGIERR